MKFNLINSLFAAIALSFLLTNCGGKSEETTSEETTTVVDEDAPEVTYALDTEATKVRWAGNTRGVQVYGHYGLIDVKEGAVMAKGNMITGGEIVIDMTTIQPTDSASYNEENPPSKLVGHLSTGDFFLVEEYPTASFVVKSHEGNTITGDLTIRGNTNEETIELSEIEFNENGFTATGKLVFDRQKYEVSWKHYLKDVILADEIELDLTVSGSKAS